MKLLTRYILREHILPFIFALAILLFVLLANFLLRSIDKFLGKGLDMMVLLEFIFLNLAWILALAVPMAVLVATLMAFGRLSSDNEITAIRSSGIGFRSLLFPALVFGFVIMIAMTIFNNFILPDMNHKARLLSGDITRKRPDLEFDVGYFIETLPGQSVLIGSRDVDKFLDITIFSKGSKVNQRTILAESGTIETVDDGVVLHLNDGVIHELAQNPEEYRQIYFEKYQAVVPIDNMDLTRRDSKIRGDREMTLQMMQDKISNYHIKIEEVIERVNTRLKNEAGLLTVDQHTKLDSIESVLAVFEIATIDSLQAEGDNVALERFKRHFRNFKRGIQSDFRLLNSYSKSINKYLVEINKKFSIPVASIIFILIGAPLGIMAQRGGFAVSMAMSLGFFIIYWAFLIAGEELADRNFLSPYLSMWLPNIILGMVGIYLCWSTAREQRVLKFELLNIFKFRKKKENDIIIPE